LLFCMLISVHGSWVNGRGWRGFSFGALIWYVWRQSMYSAYYRTKEVDFPAWIDRSDMWAA
jgi:hypothetical protein